MKTREKQGQMRIVQERWNTSSLKGMSCIMSAEVFRCPDRGALYQCKVLWFLSFYVRDWYSLVGGHIQCRRNTIGSLKKHFPLFSPTQKSPSNVWPSMQNSSFLKLSSSLLKILGYLPWERRSCDTGTVFPKWQGKCPATIALSEENTAPFGSQRNS